MDSIKFLCDTRTEIIGDDHYCVYCGRKAYTDMDFDDGYPYKTYHYCECEQASREIEMKSLIRQIEKQYIFKVDPLVINRIRYDYEIEQLKRKFSALGIIEP